MVLISIFLLSATIGFGQKGALHTSSKKAKKLFLEAEKEFYLQNFEQAVFWLEEALLKDSLFIEANLMMGEAYQELGQNSNAITAYKKVISIDSLWYHSTYYYLADLEFGEGMYADAKSHYDHYLIDPASIVSRNKSLKNSADCDFALWAMKNPVPFEPMNMGAGINSTSAEYFPCVTADGQQFLFTRLVEDNRSISGKQEDFYISYLKGSEWLPAVSLQYPINTTANEGAPSLSTDGNILFFTACENVRKYETDRKIIGRCDLFVAKKVGDQWLNPYNIGEPVNSRSWESQPSFSSDGRSLYFVSNRDGGYDLFVTEVDDQGIWSEPVKLPETINSPGYEGFAFIHPDNRTLYFASDGHVGMGKLDLYYSRKDYDGNWSEPVNLGYPINTHNDENSLTVAADGRTAYFSSDRIGGEGDLDLYSFELYPDARPSAVTYVKGVVYDFINNEKLEARFELTDLATGELAVRSFSNKGNGEFLVCLPTNRDYALNVSKEGYLFFSENFSLTGNQTSINPFRMDIPMKKLARGESVVLKNIFFETDQYALLKESRIELDKLYALLLQNPAVRIEIIGHTDNVGTEEHNTVLSENRARAVYDYLIDKGISAGRLQYSGKGESSPIDSNETEAGRALNRRTEFRVL